MTDIDGWNDRIVAEFRANNGDVRFSDADDLAVGSPVPPVLPGFGESDDAPIILVHTIGARSGRVRINPVLYRLVEDNFAVFATYGGSPRRPSWYHNLRVNPTVTVEAGTDTIAATARVTEGAERARIWFAQIADMPAFVEFETAARREIPVVLFTDCGPGSANVGIHSVAADEAEVGGFRPMRAYDRWAARTGVRIGLGGECARSPGRRRDRAPGAVRVPRRTPLSFPRPRRHRAGRVVHTVSAVDTAGLVR